MLDLALKSKLPLITAQTDDLLNIHEIIEHAADEGVVLIEDTDLEKLGHPGFQQGYTYFLIIAPDDLVPREVHELCTETDRSLVIINPNDPMPEAFDAGVVKTPQELLSNLLNEWVQEDKISHLLSVLGGLSLKDASDVCQLCMAQNGSLTPRGVTEIRRMYIGRLKGLQQVDTNFPYYSPPQNIIDWLGTDGGLLKRDIPRELIPRGLLFDGIPGCLAGNSAMTYKRGKRSGGRGITLESLYKRFNGIPDGRNPWTDLSASTYTHSMRNDGSLFYNRIISITEAGVKSCITITTSSGSFLTLTLDHPVCLDSGEFVPSGKLSVGSLIRMKGSMLPRSSGGKKKRVVHRKEQCVKHHPIAGSKTVNGIVYKRLHYSRVVFEAHMNKLTVNNYIQRLNDGLLAGLKFLPSDYEVHHMDEDVRNDKLPNLIVMQKAAHARHHSKRENFDPEYVVDEVITSITPAGGVMTYDIQMDMPYHNFVVSNFIVHNTGKTLGAKYIANQLEVPLFRLDLGGMLGKYVGESEGNLNFALSQIDQAEPAVLLIDEVEKLFTGDNDSGVTTRLLSTLLWWLQEHDSRVLTLFTTNEITKLPDELYRPGRVDRIISFTGLAEKEGKLFGWQVAKTLKGTVKLPKSEVSIAISTAYDAKEGTNALSQAEITQVIYRLAKEVLASGK